MEHGRKRFHERVATPVAKREDTHDDPRQETVAAEADAMQLFDAHCWRPGPADTVCFQYLPERRARGARRR